MATEASQVAPALPDLSPQKESRSPSNKPVIPKLALDGDKFTRPQAKQQEETKQSSTAPQGAHNDSVFNDQSQEKSMMPDTGRFGATGHQRFDGSTVIERQSDPTREGHQKGAPAGQWYEDSVFQNKPSIIVDSNGKNNAKYGSEMAANQALPMVQHMGTSISDVARSPEAQEAAGHIASFQPSWYVSSLDQSKSGMNSARFQNEWGNRPALNTRATKPTVRGSKRRPFAKTQANSPPDRNHPVFSSTGWDQAASRGQGFSQGLASQADEAGGGNILMQMLQQSYATARQAYEQKRIQKQTQPNKIARDVMAALTDPSVKNKQHLISKICGGEIAMQDYPQQVGLPSPRGQMRTRTQGHIQMAVLGEFEVSQERQTLIQFLENCKRSKPKSQAMTARSNRTKGHKVSRNTQRYQANTHSAYTGPILQDERYGQKAQNENTQNSWHPVNQNQVILFGGKKLDVSDANLGSTLSNAFEKTQQNSELASPVNTMHMQSRLANHPDQPSKLMSGTFHLSLNSNNLRQHHKHPDESGMGSDSGEAIATDRIQVNQTAEQSAEDLDTVNSSAPPATATVKDNSRYCKHAFINTFKKRQVFKKSSKNVQPRNSCKAQQGHSKAIRATSHEVDGARVQEKQEVAERAIKQQRQFVVTNQGLKEAREAKSQLKMNGAQKQIANLDATTLVNGSEANRGFTPTVEGGNSSMGPSLTQMTTQQAKQGKTTSFAKASPRRHIEESSPRCRATQKVNKVGALSPKRRRRLNASVEASSARKGNKIGSLALRTDNRQTEDHTKDEQEQQESRDDLESDKQVQNDDLVVDNHHDEKQQVQLNLVALSNQGESVNDEASQANITPVLDQDADEPQSKRHRSDKHKSEWGVSPSSRKHKKKATLSTEREAEANRTVIAVQGESPVVKSVVQKSTVFSFSSVPDRSVEDVRKAIPAQKRALFNRSLLAAQKFNQRVQGNDQRKVARNKSPTSQFKPVSLNEQFGSARDSQGAFPALAPVTSSEESVAATLHSSHNSNGGIKVENRFKQLVQANNPSVSTMIRYEGVDAGTSPMDFQDSENKTQAHKSQSTTPMNQVQKMYRTANLGAQLNFTQLFDAENSKKLIRKPTKDGEEPQPDTGDAVEEEAPLFESGKYQSPRQADTVFQYRQFNNLAEGQALKAQKSKDGMHTHHLSMVMAPVIPKGDKQSYNELNKISEGVFSSEGGLSPVTRGLIPQYTHQLSRPQTQDRTKRPRLESDEATQGGHHIVLENCLDENGQNTGLVSINSQMEQSDSSDQQPVVAQSIQLVVKPQNAVPHQGLKQKVRPHKMRSNAHNKFVLDTDGNTTAHFNLNSLKDDRSVLQEDLASVRTTEERLQVESELQEILQPEFIKSIGLVKNGEIVQPVSLKQRQKRPKRLERRLECQTQRVIKPNSQQVTAPHQHVKVDYKPLNAKICGNETLSVENSNSKTVEKFKQRSDARRNKFPVSFMKQRASYQIEKYQQQINSLPMPLAQEFPFAEDQLLVVSVQAEDQSLQPQQVIQNITISQDKAHVSIKEESTIDFDIEELQKFEQHPAGQEAKFANAQALPAKAFSLGISQGASGSRLASNDQFIPHVRPSAVHVSQQQHQSRVSAMQPSSPQVTEKEEPPVKSSLQSPQSCHQVKFDLSQGQNGQNRPAESQRKSAVYQFGVKGGTHQLVMIAPDFNQSVQVSQIDAAAGRRLATTNFGSTNLSVPRSFNPVGSVISTELAYKGNRAASLRYGSQQRSKREFVGPNEQKQLAKLQSVAQKEILSLGKTPNLRKQNQRKYILSMENRRLCSQEDRVFNERIKLATVMTPAALLPRVNNFKGKSENSIKGLSSNRLSTREKPSSNNAKETMPKIEAN